MEICVSWEDILKILKENQSKKAKEIKLADKLKNLRDMQQIIPVGWSKERVQEYFIWAKKVTDGARGINQKLEEQLDEIYSKGTFIFEGKKYKSHPE